MPQHCVYSMSHNKLLVLKVADFDVKASLSNKSEQKLRSLNSRWLASYTWPLFESLYYSHVHGPYLPARFARSEIKSLARYSGILCWLYCETTSSGPTLHFSLHGASSGSAGMLRQSKTPSACMSGAYILAFFADSAMILALLLV